MAYKVVIIVREKDKLETIAFETETDHETNLQTTFKTLFLIKCLFSINNFVQRVKF